MPRILITGANSFIGTNFIKNSKFKEIDEVSLYDISPGKIDFSNYDVVIHLSAIVHKSKQIPKSEYFAINRDLACRVAENARKVGVRQFIFLSTIKVYGELENGSEPWKEDSVCRPVDAYGRSKFEAEKAIQLLENKEFIVSIIRTPIVYGPGVKANMLQLIKMVEKFPLLPFAGVNNNRHFTYVENLVGFIDRIVETELSGTFLVMDDNSISTTRLVNYLAAGLNRKTRLFKLPEFIVRAGCFLCSNSFNSLFGSFLLDNSKTKEILKYSPPYATEEGITKMISSYLTQKNINPLK